MKNELLNRLSEWALLEKAALATFQKPHNNYIHVSWIRIIKFPGSGHSVIILSSKTVDGCCACSFSIV